MGLDAATRQRIDALIASQSVVLFMKGSRQQPQCGFSAEVVEILNHLLPHYATVDVLADPALRGAIKDYSSWPTVPQLYVRGEFLGGCDIVRDLYASGELQRTLGVEGAGEAAPALEISDAAAAALRQLHSDPERRELVLHLAVDARYRGSLYFGSPRPGDLSVEANGVPVAMDPLTAGRADGVRLDLVQTDDGPAFHLHNPNAPPPG